MNELEQYLEIRPDKRIMDPIAWWVERKQTFPRLSRLTLDLPAIPAMADHCERQFSLAKLSVSTQRCRSRPERLSFYNCFGAGSSGAASFLEALAYLPPESIELGVS